MILFAFWSESYCLIHSILSRAVLNSWQSSWFSLLHVSEGNRPLYWHIICHIPCSCHSHLALSCWIPCSVTFFFSFMVFFKGAERHITTAFISYWREGILKFMLVFGYVPPLFLRIMVTSTPPWALLSFGDRFCDRGPVVCRPCLWAHSLGHTGCILPTLPMFVIYPSSSTLFNRRE